MKKNKVLSSATQGVVAKLAPRFAGPYTITKVLGSNTYELTDRGGTVNGNAHVVRAELALEKVSIESRAGLSRVSRHIKCATRT